MATIFVRRRRKSCNRIDSRCYAVTKRSDSDSSGETFAKLVQFSNGIMRHLRSRHVLAGTPGAHRDATKRLLRGFNPDNLVENEPTGGVDTSYVEDKGRVFAMCLRERESGKFKLHDMHLLQFVMLHEMAHIACESYGHGQEFWRTFKFILTEAHDAGLYTPINYAKSPVVYCSLHVDYNPFYDASI